MEEIELIEKRGFREKHFLQKDGTIIAKMYDVDIHYLKDGKFEEIDNTLVRKDDCLVNKSNDYKVEFKDNFKDSLMRMMKDNYYIDFKLQNLKDNIIQPQKRLLSKESRNITYNDITDDITVEYQTLSNKVKETIVLQNANYSELNFELDTNLTLNVADGEIISSDDNGNIIFKIEKPFMIDSSNIRNDNVYYIVKQYKDGYIVKLILDDEWLNSTDRVFPIYIDPTIDNGGESLSIYDTYIFPGDQNINRNNQDVLKAGVEKVDGVDRVNRTLVKFDLPEIGTGSEIISADLGFIGYPSTINSSDVDSKLVSIHRVTKDWNETTATWNEMNDSYEKKVESVFECWRSSVSGTVISASYIGSGITNLVKKWYKDTPNYGILIKSIDEKYIDEDYPAFFSKDNTMTQNPKPYFTIQYRNQNGIEPYLNYNEQAFSMGKSCINTYNGNLTGIFNIGKTNGGTFPINLQLIYNTNDVVLNKNIGYGKGYKLNYHQTIKNVNINNTEYLEYEDEDGTLHYFQKKKTFFPLSDYEDNLYLDEDGLGLEIMKDNDVFNMIDKNGNKMLFEKSNNIYYLTKITDADGNTVTITYNNENKISNIRDRNNQDIKIIYNSGKINIGTPHDEVVLTYNNNKPVLIQSVNGALSIEYNENDIISNIEDISKIKMKYYYYENKPYRIKEVKQFGVNDISGKTLEIEYGFNCTTLKDNKGRYETLIFNSHGNLLSKNNLGSINDVNNAYSLSLEYEGYDLGNTNKLTSSSNPTTYIKNYLKNTSFETDEDYFSLDSEKLIKTFSNDIAYSGNRSLKVKSLEDGHTLTQFVAVPKGNYYTFSGYFKNNNSLVISLSYFDSNNSKIFIEQEIDGVDNFTRNDITIYYDDDATSDLIISIKPLSTDIIYIDDIQLERGEVANAYNLIENSDFSNGYSDWTFKALNEKNENVSTDQFFELVKFNDNKNTSLRVKMNPLYNTSFEKKFPITGKYGDLYTISFWYKNEGIEKCRQYAGNTVTIVYEPADENQDGHCPLTSVNFNSNERWQFYSYRVRALENFKSISLIFSQNTQANDFYITNISFYREPTSGDFQYDENGNLVSITNQSKEKCEFNYDNKNQLVEIKSTTGDTIKYEYDNEKQDRILESISETGIVTKVEYDDYGNQIKKTIKKCYVKDIKDGNYRIRCKGTNKYLKAELNYIMAEKNLCSNTIWMIKKENDKIMIKYSINPDYLMTYNNDNISLKKSTINNLFEFEVNSDGSIYIFVNDGNEKKYLKETQGNIELDSNDERNESCKFYIEDINDLFLESRATYSSDGKYLTSITNESNNTSSYIIDSVSGLLTSTTNPAGIQTKYVYNDKNQISSIITKEASVNYLYNDANLLSSINLGNKNYNVEYDNFQNLKSMSIGNSIKLFEKDYESQNGNLIKNTYGNDDVIMYEYDNFDRLSKVIKQDDVYEIKYDNNGRIAKVISSDSVTKNRFDISGRLFEYINNNFKIIYTYDSKNNVVKNVYKLNNKENVIDNTFNEKNLIDKLSIGNDSIKYNYDSLNRITGKTINNKYCISYKYKNYGKRTTALIESIKNSDDEYSYEYDSLDNITQIYHNNEIINKYGYNDYNELILVEDYSKNEKIEYTYDLYGNILSKVRKSLVDNEIISTNNYEYNNSDWKDLLTKYDDQEITYDKIGNPITIGDSISLSWKNGKELLSYIDNLKQLNISYKYNESGIRTTKIVNGVKTNYYFDGTQIVLEEKNNNCKFYVRDETGLIGFKYNDRMYYYVKNIQGDIIAILDDNYSKVVEYYYDSWGNILNVIDNSGENIGLENPYRYRSYYYDNETQLYYLNTRYYNPRLGRFINADDMIGASENHTGYNLFTYVGNNPVNNVDTSGKFLGKIIKAIKKTAKKIIKKITSALSKPKSTKKSSTKNLSTSVKKASSTKSSSSNKKSGAGFVAEFGVGYGASLNIDRTGLSLYQDKTYGYSFKDGFYSNITGSNSIGIGIIGGGYGYTHEYPFDENEPGWRHSPYDTQVIPNCERTESSWDFNFLIFHFDDKGGGFIGFDADVHAIYGGHIKFGIEW